MLKHRPKGARAGWTLCGLALPLLMVQCGGAGTTGESDDPSSSGASGAAAQGGRAGALGGAHNIGHAGDAPASESGAAGSTQDVGLGGDSAAGDSATDAGAGSSPTGGSAGASGSAGTTSGSGGSAGTSGTTSGSGGSAGTTSGSGGSAGTSGASGGGGIAGTSSGGGGLAGTAGGNGQSGSAGSGGVSGSAGSGGVSGSAGGGGVSGSAGSGGVSGSAGSGECSVQLTTYTSPSAAHVPVCSAISYPMNPPVYGNHYPVWAAYKSYTFAVPLGFLVHDLEHGAVDLLYNCPEGCAEEVAAAQAFIDGLPADPRCSAAIKHQIAMSPDPSLPTRWAAISWGHSLTADCFAPQAFRAFYDANLNHGPENTCGNGTDIQPTTCPP